MKTPEEKKARRLAKARYVRRLSLLGKFVEEYEAAVAIIRHECIEISQGFKRGIELKPELVSAHVHICEIAFSHPYVPSRALIDCWRAMTYHMLALFVEEKRLIDYEIRLRKIAKEFCEINALRNSILHADWDLQDGPTPDWPLAFKNTVDRRGIAEDSKLPSNIPQLLSTINRCMKLNETLLRLRLETQALYVSVPLPASP